MSEPASELKSVMLNSREIEIPVKWDIKILGEVSEKTKGTKPDTLYEEPNPDRLPYLTISASKGEVSQWAQADEGKRVFDEDILMVWDGASSGSVFKSTEGVIGSTLASFNFDDSLDNDFAYYFLKLCESRISTLTEGTGISHVPRDFTEIFQVLKPPVPEQRRIADILSKVDNQIQQTRETINIYEELQKGERQDLLEGEANNSGKGKVRIGPVEYSVPSNWETLPVEKILAKEKKAIRGGPAGSRIKKEDRSNSGYKLYFQENIIHSDFDYRDNYINEEKFKELSDMEPVPGDILVTLTGNVGECAVFPEGAERGIYESNVMRIRVNDEMVLPEYLCDIIDKSKIIDDQIRAMSHGGSRKKLNNKIVKSITVPLPPKEEQKEIVKILSKIGSKIELEQNTLEKQKMIKRGLMQDLLTGKVRVSREN
jgi:type I restriction enzyme S subunit